MNSEILSRSASETNQMQTRGRTKILDNRKPNVALIEAKRKAKNLKVHDENIVESIKDVFQNALNSATIIRGETGIVFYESIDACVLKDEHEGLAESFKSVIKHLKELYLIEQCRTIPSRKATKEEILTIYNESSFDAVNYFSRSTYNRNSENIGSFFIRSTFDLSLLSAGCTIDLIDNIVKKEVQNGIALVPTLGRKATISEFNDYCSLNNITTAVYYSLNILKLKRILIVDFGVHIDQGPKHYFYDDPRVLYFSIYRLDLDKLEDSNYNCIGDGDGIGYNFNIPLNTKCMQNEDYLSIFQKILLPVAYEFQPELVVVSAGYDTDHGYTKGEKFPTTSFFAHIIKFLMNLANGKLVVILDGKFSLLSFTELASVILRALLDYPNPVLLEKRSAPSAEVCETILNCIYVHRFYWKCLNVQDTYTLDELNRESNQSNLHKIIQVHRENSNERHSTRITHNLTKIVKEKVISLEYSTNLIFPSKKLCYVYDEKMCQHRNIDESDHPECPERITNIQSKFNEFGLTQRMYLLPSRIATTDEICLAHTRLYLNFVRRLSPKQNFNELAKKFNSVYLNENTFECATIAAGSVLNVIDSVLTNRFRSGLCVIRPPGHHAEPDHPHGFCIFNNVAIAAQYAIRNGINKILIVDWDIHHGNGTQHIFERSANVLYISIHRYDNATFFPKKTEANFDFVGTGIGEGFNVNIPWNKKGMTDLEYIMVMQQIVLPIAYEFNPELVLVSAGFDAAVGDPLGGCKVTPEGFGLFTHWLSGLANGRLIICLEGGYNLNSVAFSMTLCAKALLGDPLPMPAINKNKTIAFDSCSETIRNVVNMHSKYWKALQFGLKSPHLFNNDLQSLQVEIDELQISSCH
ncbi:hda-6 family protein [Megaselia abdita]